MVTERHVLNKNNSNIPLFYIDLYKLAYLFDLRLQRFLFFFFLKVGVILCEGPLTLQ